MVAHFREPTCYLQKQLAKNTKTNTKFGTCSNVQRFWVSFLLCKVNTVNTILREIFHVNK